MDESILSDFGINLLEEEIDDVIFQTNEFLCDATFTGTQGPFWWLSQFVAEFLAESFINQPLTDLPLYGGKMSRDKNGTKTMENKSFQMLSPTGSFKVLFAPTKLQYRPAISKFQRKFLAEIIQPILMEKLSGQFLNECLI